jgi:hypothetical protein
MTSLINEPGTISSEIWVSTTRASGEGKIQVTWTKMGSEFSYDVLYAKFKEGPWIQDNAIRLDDSNLEDAGGVYSAYNLYTIDELSANTIYFVRIECYDKYDSWWCSYISYSSVGGGLGREDDPPEYPFGNDVGFKFSI